MAYKYGGFVDVAGNTTMQFFTQPTINITERGYIYVYLSNESTTTSGNAFFDELNIRITSPIVQADDYYPFGMTIAESAYRNSNGKVNNYLYNGKELQDELDLGWLDYGARMYMPKIGRFFVKDRFTELYPSIISYQYTANNPIRLTDINGDYIDVYGFGAIVQQKVWKGFFGYAEYQYLSTPVYGQTSGSDTGGRSWHSCLPIGIGSTIRISEAINSQVILSYDFLHNSQSPNPKAWNIKFGFQLGKLNMGGVKL